MSPPLRDTLGYSNDHYTTIKFISSPILMLPLCKIVLGWLCLSSSVAIRLSLAYHIMSFINPFYCCRRH